MHSSESPNVRSRMRRQLVQQQRQQQQQQANHPAPADRELPAKQDQTRHNPVSETWQRGAFTSDQ
jgi:hypothetical protein